ncbi:MAG: phosphate ABC transporter permease subunit PstC, partial [Chloroflexota bacterium]
MLRELKSGQPEARIGERVVERLIQATGLSAILFILLIFAFLIRESAPTFVEVPLGDLLGTRWYPIEAYYGLLPLIFGSVVVT